MNLPVLVGAGLVSVPLAAVRFPAIPEWLFYVMMLPFVALLWYWIGARMDRNRPGHASAQTGKWQWVALLIFMSGCVLASTVPSPLGGYISFLVFGALLWLFAALAALRFLALRAKKSKMRATENFRDSR